jgi:hypothetical protein
MTNVVNQPSPDVSQTFTQQVEYFEVDDKETSEFVMDDGPLRKNVS